MLKGEMYMQMNYVFDKYGRLSNVTFEGLSGLESVSNLKEAVNMLVLTNPAKTFAAKMKSGYYEPQSNALIERDANIANTLSGLFKLSANDSVTRPEMNVMMLLASAFTTIVRQANEIKSLKNTLEDIEYNL